MIKHATPSNQMREQANSTQAKKKVNAKKKVASPFKQVNDFMAQDGSSLLQQNNTGGPKKNMPKLKLGNDLFRDTFKRMTEFHEVKTDKSQSNHPLIQTFASNSSREQGLLGFRGSNFHAIEKPIFNSTQSQKQKH